MPDSMSEMVPTGTLPPNPPVLVGHRKATKLAAEKVPMLAAISEIEARLKNWRRLTPSASGSGGVHGVRPVSAVTGARPVADAGDRAFGLDLGGRGGDGAGGAFVAGRGVARHGFGAERAGAADVATSRQGHERNRGEDADDSDGDEDGCGGIHGVTPLP